MKKTVVLCTVMAVLAALVSCSKKAETAASAVQSEFIEVSVALTADPGSLAPWAPISDGQKMYIEIYEFLFGYTSFGSDLEGFIGKSYEQLDAQTFRVQIYNNVSDSKGNKINADDVIWSYETAAQINGMPDRVRYISSIEKVDDYTLDFNFNKAINLVEFGATMQVYIIDQAEYESAGADAFARNPVGTGPYVIDTYTTGSSYTLVKNKTYWKNESDRCILQTQNADKIVYKIISEPAQVAIALESGEIQLADINAENISYFYDVKTRQTAGGWFVSTDLAVPCASLILNCSEKSVLQDQNLRLALLYAVDNQALLDLAMNGEGEIEYTNGGQQYRGFQQAMIDGAASNVYAHDPGKAKEYLRASGYGEGGKQLTVKIMPHVVLRNAAQALQGQLLEAGIKSDIVAYDPALYETYRRQDDQWDVNMAFMGKSSGLLSDYWGHHLTIKSYGAANMIRDQALNVLYEKTTSVDATNEDIMACHNYFTEKGYFYGLFNGLNYRVGKKGVTNIVESGLYGIVPGACSYSGEYNL
jgi:ABC-type transport system substrate-binding protein